MNTLDLEILLTQPKDNWKRTDEFVEIWPQHFAGLF